METKRLSAFSRVLYMFLLSLVIFGFSDKLARGFLLSNSMVKIVKDMQGKVSLSTLMDKFVMDENPGIECVELELDVSLRNQELNYQELEDAQLSRYIRAAGIFKFYSGCYNDASEILALSYRRESSDPTTLLFWGLAEGLIGNRKQALRAWQSISDIQILSDNLGYEAFSMSKFNTAVKWFDLSQSQGTVSRSPIIYEGACISYQNVGRLNDALAQCMSLHDLVLGKQEWEARVSYQLGAVYLRLGDYRNALLNLQLAKKLSSKKISSIHFLVGQAYDGLERYTDAINEFQVVISLKSTDELWARLFLGIDYVRVGAIENAETQFTEVIEQGTDSEIDQSEVINRAYQQLAKLYISQNEYHKSRDLMNIALTSQDSSNEYIYRFILGNAYLGLNDKLMAKSEFENSINLNPEYGEAHLALAKILIDEDRREDAKEHLHIVLSVSSPEYLIKEAESIMHFLGEPVP